MSSKYHTPLSNKLKISRADFEKLLEKEFQNNPDLPTKDIVNKVKQQLSGDTIPDPGPVKPSQWWTSRKLWLAGAIFIVVIGIAAAAIFKPWESDPPGDMTLTPSGTIASANSPANILFGSQSPTTVATGQAVSLTLEVYDVDGNLIPAEDLSVRVDPPEAGSVTEPVPGTGGEFQISFTAGDNAQTVNLIAEAGGESRITKTHTLTIAARPSLVAKFKDPQPTDPFRVGESFNVSFQVDNTGGVIANNVRLIIDTPNGLTIDHADEGCEEPTENGRICNFGDVVPGQNGSKNITYRADQPVNTGFMPENYRLVYNGGQDEILGSESRTFDIQNPRAERLSIISDLTELAADGTMTTTLRVAVFDQWGVSYNGSSTVNLSVDRDEMGGEQDVSTPPTPPIMPLTLNCTATISIPFTNAQTAADDGQNVDLPLNTLLQAIYFDPDTDEIFVRITLDGVAQEGWVKRANSEGMEQVKCNGDVTSLPLLPATEPYPDGVILENPKILTAEGSFVYQSGTQPGTVKIMAQLVDGQGNLIGDPVEVSLMLLVVETLKDGVHLYNSAEAASNKDPNGNGILLFRMPAGTPIALKPQLGDGPLEAVVAIWVPSSIVTANTLTVTELTGVFVGSGPNDELNRPVQDNQQLQILANQAAVKILEIRNDWNLTRVLLNVWIPADGLLEAE